MAQSLNQLKSTIARIKNSKLLRVFRWDKQRFVKFCRNVTISFVVLFALSIVAGLVYTWYIGNNSVVIQTDDLSEPVSSQLSKPSKTDPKAPVGVSVQSVTSSVAPGENASITIKTNQDVECSIKVEYNKIAVEDSGLINKQSGEYGVVQWKWVVANSAPTGTWPVGVTCFKNDKSGYVRADLKIVK